MVKIRLRRVGAKKQPYYRVVVTDARSPRDGKFIETIGNYNPRTEPPTMVIDLERARYWLSVGAQPTDAVRRILDKLMAAEATEARPSVAELVAKEPAAAPPEPEAEAVEAEPEAEAVEAEPEGEATPEAEAAA